MKLRTVSTPLVAADLRRILHALNMMGNYNTSTYRKVEAALKEATK